MPSFPELPEPLSDGSVELRLAREWDIPDILIAHQDDPDLYKRLGLSRPPSGAELGRRSEYEPAHRASGTGVRLTVVEPGGDTCRGQLEVYDVDWEEGSAELGIWLAPQVRGRGWAPRSLRLAAAWLFRTCGLQRLTLLTDSDNQPLLGAAQAAGFIRQQNARGPDQVSLALARPPRGPATA